MDEDILDYTKLKYVLYARKSTTDETRQIRSIQDQIYECKLLAKRLGLNIVKIIEETQSAKVPNRRPLFRQMLSQIKKKEYDAILAWNPDRLARNMLEGGEIINMIDESQIQDLKFVTHHFTKDANGKMLLGMAFVLSKQYSDDLSQKVTRGVSHNFSEGKSSASKHGYLRSAEGYYQPDKRTFNLIVKAFKMRCLGNSIKSITEYLNLNGYSKKTKTTKRSMKMTHQMLSTMFKDGFYYGILAQSNQTVDLRTIYKFIPAVTEEDFFKIQKMTYRRIKPSKPHKTAFYPLRLMILCSFCQKFMRVGPSTGSTGRSYLNYRCDTKECLRGKKSLRAKVVFEFIYSFLESGLNFSEAEYEKYYTEFKSHADEKLILIRNQLNIKQGLLKHTEHEIKEISLKIINYDKESTIWTVNNDKILELKDRQSALLREIKDLKQNIYNPEEFTISLEQFLNLSKKASVIIQSANVYVKDLICREIFLNLTVDEKKVLSYQLKEPFESLLKHHEFLNSRDGEN